MTQTAQKPVKDFKDLNPEQKADVLFKQAISFHQKDDLEKAIMLYSQSLAFNPNLADSITNMAVALRKSKRYEASLACYRRSLEIRPEHAGTYSNMGNVLNDMDMLEEAVRAHSKALKLEPENLLYQYNCAIVLRDAGMLDEAIAQFDKILETDPNFKDCPWDRSLTHLTAGNFEKGFEQYEARWNLASTPVRKFKEPRWQGEDLSGKTLFIYREQGFGDAIQFGRFLKVVKEKYNPKKIILECQPELMNLFRRLDGVDRLIPFGKRPPHFDMWLPMLSLGHVLDFTPENIPGDMPFLSVPEKSRFSIRKAPKGGLNIGMVWGGSPTHKNDRRRSLSIEKFLPFYGREGVTLFSLQKGARSEELTQAGANGLIVDPTKDINDFMDTASIMDQMDLIICVDTSVAHLAGAMGKEVWVLLPYTPDWRWLLNREDSPWYPSMRLFRQPTPGDWDGAFKKVYQALDEKLAEKARADQA